MSANVFCKKLPLALAISVALQPAFAEEPIDAGTVQVWGTQITTSSVFLNEQDIETKQADHLSDLLREVPGIDIGGAHSLNQRINIRGLQDLDLEVTIDGARQTNFMYHHAGNLLINADILKAVDIQVGNNSVINGGLGGSASFETKDAKDLLKDGKTMGGRVYGVFATNNYWATSLTGYGQFGDAFDVVGYVNYTDKDDTKDGAGVKQIGNAGEITNGLIKLGFDLNDQNRIELSYDKYQDHGDYNPRPDMGAATNNAITGDVELPTEFERDTISLTYELDLGDTVNLRATVYQNNMSLWRNDEDNPYGSSDTLEGKAEIIGLNVLAESVIGFGGVDHVLRYGMDTYTHETDYLPDGVSTSSESAQSLAVYVEDEIAFGNSGFALTPGVRYNSYKLDANAIEDTYTKVTWGLAAEYAMNNGLTLRASSTQLFKGPMLAEVFTGAGSGIPSADGLKPETGVNNEVGFVYRVAEGKASLSLGANFFHTVINDYIDDEGNGAYDNIGDYDIKGFEASINGSYGELDGRLTYAQAESENQDTNAPLGRAVGDSINFAVSYGLPQYNLTLNWGSMFVLEEDYYDKPAYQVHNVSAQWLPTQVKGLTVTLGVENLFDETYTSHASRIGDTFHPFFGNLHLNDYEPGRNVKLSVSYDF